MNRIATMFVLVMLLGFGAKGVAHEGMRHKGKPVEGEVKSIAADRLTLQAGATTVTVVLDDETKIERGDEGATKADLNLGDHLSVYGTRLGTGELVAREIVIGKAHDADMPAGTGGGMPTGHPH